ncbi:MAG: RNA polymerase subunit sigma-24 [Anaerolineales bacterium]|nr:MAG: RNA polymerase subunit sigma-24 [Anaerolineales bacterium]
MNEIALIQAARGGDLDAFNRLVLAYQDLIYNQAYRMIGEEETADDATQNTFISAYKHLNSFRGGSFKAWLLRIVTNTCYDELRRRKRRPTVPLEPLDDTGEEVESPRWMEDPADHPEEQVQRLELQKAIQHCLDKLPDDFRGAVIMVDIQGLDYSEAALSMGKPIGTIKSRLARARLRLRDCLNSFAELLPSEFRLE